MAVLTVAQLKALWIDGFIPDQTDYIDLFDTIEDLSSSPSESSGGNGEVLGYENGLIGALVSAGFGKGKFNFTNGANTIEGIDFAFDFLNNYDSANVNPFFYGEITIILPDGTYRYVTMDTEVDATNATFSSIGDLYVGGNVNNLGSVWDQPTGSYNWIPFPIGKITNSNDFGTVINCYGGVNNAPMSIMTGDGNEVESAATGSVTLGRNNVQGSKYGLVSGDGNNIQNQNEVGFGKFNELEQGSNSQRLFGIGNGSNDSARSQVVSAYSDGTFVFKPVGLSTISLDGLRAGAVIMDSEDGNKYKYYNGSEWVSLISPSGFTGSFFTTEFGDTYEVSVVNGLITSKTIQGS